MCARSVRGLCEVCARSVRGMCEVCARSVRGMCEVRGIKGTSCSCAGLKKSEWP